MSLVQSLVLCSELLQRPQTLGEFVILTKCSLDYVFRGVVSFVVYLYVSDSGSITSVGEEKAYLSSVVYL